MKNVLAYIFVGLYLISTSGMVVNYHICQGELVELGIYTEVHKCCEDADPCSETHFGKSCCRLGTMQIDVDTNHQSPDAWTPEVQNIQHEFPTFILVEKFPDLLVSFIYDVRDGPPISVPTYILD